MPARQGLELRVGELVRHALAEIFSQGNLHEPELAGRIITVPEVKMSPDLQLVRVYYTIIGDDRAKHETQKALERATPFLRRQIGARVRLRRVPELRFEFDQSVEYQDRVERILMDLAEERKLRGPLPGDEEPAATGPAVEGPDAPAKDEP